MSRQRSANGGAGDAQRCGVRWANKEVLLRWRQAYPGGWALHVERLGGVNERGEAVGAFIKEREGVVQARRGLRRCRARGRGWKRVLVKRSECLTSICS
ncbi:hypothetical protein MRB53_041057 [Persea americana]|nr:hypothetical protein MRB53_041057 [Persea americana]